MHTHRSWRWLIGPACPEPPYTENSRSSRRAASCTWTPPGRRPTVTFLESQALQHSLRKLAATLARAVSASAAVNGFWDHGKGERARAIHDAEFLSTSDAAVMARLFLS